MRKITSFVLVGLIVVSGFAGLMSPATGSNIYSLSFDGVDDYVNLPSNPNLNLNMFTIEAWVKYNSGMNNGVIVDKRYDSNDDHYCNYKLLIRPELPWTHIQIGDGSLSVMAVWYDVPAPDVWHHIVGTYSGTELVLYVDGMEKANNTTSLIPYTSNDPVTIGYAKGSTTRYFDGLIDEVRIYNRAISTTEVGEHYQGVFNDNTGLVGYWNLDEGTGQIAYDYSGNGNDGTIYGATWSTETPSGQTTSVPSAPQNLQATGGDGSVQITWNAPISDGGSAITEYWIYRGTSSEGQGSTPIGTSVGTVYTDTGLTNGQTYYYKVSAVNSVGEGTESSEVSATPTAGSALYAYLSGPTYLHPGKTRTLSVHVSDDSGVVSGASISLSSNNGGFFSSNSVSTGSDGWASVEYTAPLSSKIVTITAEISKTGYEAITKTVDIDVDETRVGTFNVKVVWETGLSYPTKAPLKNAEVMISNTYGETTTGTTGADGRVSFSSVPYGYVDIKASKPLFASISEKYSYHGEEGAVILITKPTTSTIPLSGHDNDGNFEIHVNAKRENLGGSLFDMWDSRQEISAGDWIVVDTTFINVGKSYMGSAYGMNAGIYQDHYDMSKYGYESGGWEFSEITLRDSSNNPVPFDRFKIIGNKDNILLEVQDLSSSGIVQAIYDNRGSVTWNSYFGSMIGNSILYPNKNYDPDVSLPTLELHIPANAVVTEGPCTLQISVKAKNLNPSADNPEAAYYNFEGFDTVEAQHAVWAGDPPFDMHLYDSSGNHVGINYDSGEIDLDIPGAEYTDYDPDWKIISVTNPNDTFELKAEGTDDGAYEIVVFTASDNTVTSSKEFTDTISTGETISSVATISSSGEAITITDIRDPVSSSPGGQEKQPLFTQYWWAFLITALVIFALISGVLLHRKPSIAPKEPTEPPEEGPTDETPEEKDFSSGSPPPPPEK